MREGQTHNEEYWENLGTGSWYCQTAVSQNGVIGIVVPDCIQCEKQARKTEKQRCLQNLQASTPLILLLSTK
jgi:hypothetical protein